MIDKTVASPAEAVADIFDGSTVMIGGFGEAGSPIELIHALIDRGATGLTVVNNNTGSGEVGLAALIKAGRVAKMICSYPRTANSRVFPSSIGLVGSTSNSFRRGRWPNESGQAEPVFQPSTHRRPLAHPWRTGRRPGSSTDAST